MRSIGCFLIVCFLLAADLMSRQIVQWLCLAMIVTIFLVWIVH